MGVTGLLQAVGKPTPTKISQLKGLSFVIDGHCFLHKVAYASAYALLIDDNVTPIVTRMIIILESFLKHALFVTVVFDGGSLPSKLGTNDQRRLSRAANLDAAKELLRQGRRGEANKCLSKAISFSTAQVARIAHALYKALRSKGDIAVMIAPYEADAQIAYLHKIGLADVIVTNDSDILLYGPQKVLFKYDEAKGQGDLIIDDALSASMFASLQSTTTAESATSYSIRKVEAETLFQHRVMSACILSGCDYVPSLVGVGLTKSLSAITTHHTLLPAIHLLHGEKGRPVKDTVGDLNTYVRLVVQAVLTFRYHRVLDPLSMQAVHYTPVLDEDKALLTLLDQWFYGPPHTPLAACLGAMGLVHHTAYSTGYEEDSCISLTRWQIEDFDDDCVDLMLESMQRLHKAAVRASFRTPIKERSKSTIPFLLLEELDLTRAHALISTSATNIPPIYLGDKGAAYRHTRETPTYSPVSEPTVESILDEVSNTRISHILHADAKIVTKVRDLLDEIDDEPILVMSESEPSRKAESVTGFTIIDLE
ncbi:Exonuclease 1 [Giardia muris]|uniref:Exonuclease 1 n=1 Tax=Giardia muris TaxID=5742 RepID=A0A4Z1T9X1_GIAMU|nr:Exonuclease 1 [Giardia muris]|eukprot:TNJ30017.1 Exonuclease 1 [Giardia muris]